MNHMCNYMEWPISNFGTSTLSTGSVLFEFVPFFEDIFGFWGTFDVKFQYPLALAFAGFLPGSHLRSSHFFGDGTCQNIAVGGHLVPMFIIGSSLRPDCGQLGPICGPLWCAFFCVCFVSVYCMLPFFSIQKLIQIFRRNF